jgi:hypothetical protein
MVTSSEGLGPSSDCAGTARGNCTSRFQTRPLIREGAPLQETGICHAEKNNLVMGFRWEPDTKIEWPTDRRS